MVSCSLWLSLTLNRIYETDISVSVRVKNVPNSVSLEKEKDVATRVMVRGEGTDLFGYIFDDGVTVSVDYSEFVRRGGRLTIPTNLIRSRVIEQFAPSLSIKNFLTDTLVAHIQRSTAVVPVRKNRLDLRVADGYELVSVKYEPEEVSITAFVDEIAGIKDVRTPAFVFDGIERDTVLEMTFLPGKYISVKIDRAGVYELYATQIDK